MKLAGSRVLLTGASGGIGRALAEALLEAGASLLLVARRADSLADLAQQHPQQVQVVVADLACSTGLDAVQAAVADCEARLGPIDRLVNAAAITVTPTTLPNVMAGVAYDRSLAATGGAAARQPPTFFTMWEAWTMGGVRNSSLFFL